MREDDAAPAEDWLPTLISWFEDSEDATYDARQKSERDRDYYDGKQLTAEEVETLAKRGQPPIAINRIRRKIDYLTGLEKRTRTDPKAFPRNPDDEQAADAATDGIRYVCDSARFQQVASRVWEQVLIEGAAGAEVCVKPDKKGEPQIEIVLCPWDRIFWDHHSSAPDFSDAKVLGTVTWLDEEEILTKWPGSEDQIESVYASESISDTYDDKPKFAIWGDSTRKRVRVVQAYWRWGDVWHWATFTRAGFLDEPQPSPYLDDQGEPSCPLVFMSAYVDRDNNRYGVVRDMIDPQDELNKRRSKALHLLNVRQVIADQGAVQNVPDARAEMARPDGYIEVTPGMRFDIQQTADLASGQAQLMQEAKAELDMMGPNAALMGEAGSSASGRAIALSQQGGAIENNALMDLHRDWKRRVYAAVWDRIRQFWTAEKWVRVTDDERNVRFVGLNRQVTLEDELREMPDQQQAAMLAQQMGLMPGDPRLAQVVRVENNVAEIAVDIVVEEGPDVSTLRQEQFQMLAEAAKGRPDVPIDLLIELSDLPRKEKILDRLRGKTGPDGQPMEPPPPPPDFQLKMAELEFEREKFAEEMRLEWAKLGVDANAPQPMPMQEQPDPIALAKVGLDEKRHADKMALEYDKLAMTAAQAIAAREDRAAQNAAAPA